MLRRLAHNTLIGIGATVLHKGVGFATTLVLARGLGQDGFGIYSFVGVYIFFFSFVVDLGIERVVTRELSQSPSRIGRVLGNAIVLKLCLCGVAVPAAAVMAHLMHIPAETRVCIVIAALGLPLTIDSLLRGYLQSQYRVRTIYAVTLPSSLLFLLLASLCVWTGLAVRAIFVAALVNGLFTLCALFLIVGRRVRIELRPDLHLLRLLLHDSVELGLFVLLFMLSWRLDQILLFKLRDAAEVGRYAVAVRVTEALSILPEALMLTVFPMLAESYGSKPRRFHQTYRLSLKYLTAIILPIALLLTLLRREFVLVAFGASYASSALPLAILAWGMFFAYIGAVYLNLFIVQSRQRLMLIASVIALSVNVAANLWWVPPYGATGAALAMVAGNVAGFGFWALHPTTAPFIAVCVTEAIRPLVSVLVAWGVAAVVAGGGWPAALVALAVFIVLMASFGGLNRSDVDLVRRLFATEHAA